MPYDSGLLEYIYSLFIRLRLDKSIDLLNNKKQSDIKRIEVLKDVDATAIYGARGASGVVGITTKKGWIRKIHVKLNIRDHLNDSSGFVNLLNSEQCLEVCEKAIENGDRTQETTLASMVDISFNQMYSIKMRKKCLLKVLYIVSGRKHNKIKKVSFCNLCLYF